ncbi:hypothetical protein LC612_32505 [Nostoc sp. CHAB 5834]|nr:hypothetical protein [Nostoc sp. CHAB 5834]
MDKRMLKYQYSAYAATPISDPSDEEIFSVEEDLSHVLLKPEPPVWVKKPLVVGSSRVVGYRVQGALVWLYLRTPNIEALRRVRAEKLLTPIQATAWLAAQTC